MFVKLIVDEVLKIMKTENDDNLLISMMKNIPVLAKVIGKEIENDILAFMTTFINRDNF